MNVKKIFLLNLIALRFEIILQLQGCFGTLGSVHKFCKQGKKNKTATPKKLFQDFFIFLFFFRVLSLSGQSKQAYRHVLFNFLLLEWLTDLRTLLNYFSLNSPKNLSFISRCGFIRSVEL